jgi:hypothetical protein
VKLESPKNKLSSGSSEDVALEATHLIQKMVRHILYDGCDHCRHILKDNNNDEAGNHPAPTAATQHTQSNQGVSITK